MTVLNGYRVSKFTYDALDSKEKKIAATHQFCPKFTISYKIETSKEKEDLISYISLTVTNAVDINMPPHLKLQMEFLFQKADEAKPIKQLYLETYEMVYPYLRATMQLLAAQLGIPNLLIPETPLSEDDITVCENDDNC